ncbi:GNAT family N-acetyltransferase [uncultured Dokdonia sp.]|uniref:GNAT family N-acetyltransferase n=1 Tax=uncultured Dokdonia sp. TaxID=575653 RepID=UPI00260E7432|nr:GNAT family N-acetyltransferase [uncultured Dokdonia sp.]
MTFIRTTAAHTDFKMLVQLLDNDLARRDGDEHAFYHQFNTIDSLKHCVVLYQESNAVGCGAIKTYNPTTVEVKRIYIIDSQRGKGLATQVLTNLESWAKELGYTRCVLETGVRQPEAIALYEKNGYARIPNYGQYIGVENSVCFEKLL